MTLDDCAETLRAHDPDRLGICLLAGADARPRLLTLYALNLELARAPLASNEPLIAEMRLQWWVERLEKIGAGAPPTHDLLALVHEAWGPRASALAALAEPRRRDALREPHDGPAALGAYIRDTAVSLARFAAQAVEAPEAARPAIEAQAEGVGLANWLAALPALQGIGLGLWDAQPAVLAEIAANARAKLDLARSLRRTVPRGSAAVLFPGPGVRAILRAAPHGIEALAGVAPSEFRRRYALGAFALTHRWWV